jgi:Zn-dependent protease
LVGDPLTWALPVARLAGVLVRVHALFLLLVAILMLRSVLGGPVGTGPFDHAGPLVMAVVSGALFVSVLVHELGHCLACRLAGGAADEILIWPLGGLVWCRPPAVWRSHLLAALGGPAVNLLLCVVAAVMLRIDTGRWLGTAIPSPWGAGLLDQAFGLGALWSWPQRILMVLNWTSLLVLSFNLLPILPLDGGRVLHALLWPRLGDARALRMAVGVGYLGALVLGLCGAVLGQMVPVAVAVVCGLACHFEARRLELGLSDAAATEVEAEPAPGAAAPPGAPSEGDEEQAVDEILAKIQASGMESLSRSELRLLRRVTERRRQQHGHS